MRTLPSILNIKGEEYILEECHIPESDKLIPNWWSFSYRQLNNGLPPRVFNGKYFYFLCSCEETKEAAYNDLLDRVNSMVNG